MGEAMSGRSLIRLAPVAVLSLLAVAACGGSSSGGGGGGGGGGAAGGTFTFGTAADPISMDPSYVSDGESLRVSRLIYDTLVSLKPGTTNIQPDLATSWESSDSKNWTFHLRDGVKLTDGKSLDAQAVCGSARRPRRTTAGGRIERRAGASPRRTQVTEVVEP